MTEPCTDRVDVHTGAEQMHGGRVADGVRTDPLVPQRRHVLGCLVEGTLDQGVEAVACDRLSADVEEDARVARTIEACTELAP